MRGEVLLRPLQQDEVIMIDDIDSPYASIPSLKAAIYARGLNRSGAPPAKVARSEAGSNAFSLKYEAGSKKGE